MQMSRMVLIGAGIIGNKHATLIQNSDECRLVGICDLDPAAAALADQHEVPFATDLPELLSRVNPDGAIVATSNQSHALCAETCARFGLPMLIEKPIADTLENACRIIAVAEGADVPVLVGHHRRYNPLVKAAQQVIHQKTLGALVGVSVLWTLHKPDEYFETGDWRKVRPGGGPGLINLIHDIDTLRFVCGEIDQIHAQMSSAVRGFEVEDSLSVNLRFRNGALGTILASDAVAAPWAYELNMNENPDYYHIDQNCYYFVGTGGSLGFPRMDLWQFANSSQVGWQHQLDKNTMDVDDADPLESQLNHFCQVIRGTAEPFITARDGTQSLAAILAVLDSARHNQPVALSAVI